MAGTSDDNSTPFKGKSGLNLPAGFAEHFKLPVGLDRLRLPPELAVRLKAALALPPEVTRKLRRLVAESSPEVRKVRDHVYRLREEVRICEEWLADRGIERESQPPAPALPSIPGVASAGSGVNESVEQSPPPDRDEWAKAVAPEFARVPPKLKSKWVEEEAFPRMLRELGKDTGWQEPKTLRRALYKALKKN
jgi:hypothetical protein